MSSTNRGGQRSAKDYYVTPIHEVVTFLKALQEDFPQLASTKLRILDPCAGGDAEHEMSYPAAIKQVWPHAEVMTIDIREDSKAEFLGDYLTSDIDMTPPDIVMSNPPFSLAQEFINKGLKDVAKGGLVIMLLRLNFFGAQKRMPWWHKTMPVYSYVHNERMSFTPNGKTDSIEYMHCVWVEGQNPKTTMLRVI